MRLIPKDEGFFDLFEQQVDKLTVASRLLGEMLRDPAHFDRYIAQIKEIERQADEVTRTINQRLDSSFVTPLDREDIHLLASRIDSVVDLIDGAARRIKMFRVSDVPEPAHALVDVLIRATDVVAGGVKGVKVRATVVKCSADAKRLEEEADVIYGEAVGALFVDGADPIHVIKWKALFDQIEDAVDWSEDVANVLDSVSLKNS